MLRSILVGIVAASVALTSAASARPDVSTVPPPVGRIAKQLAGGGAKRVIVFASAKGKSYVATAGTQRPKAGQRFRVGSVTKTFTATVVLQLVDDGKLGLSDTLESHLPGVVPRGAEITIRELLQHRSGLVNYTDYTSWLKGPSRAGTIRPIDLLRFAGSKPLAFDPGAQWSYSNTNYIALGLVIEQITGSSYGEMLERRIFRPLGLDATELPRTRLLPDLGDDDIASPLSEFPTGDPYYDVDWATPNISWAAGGIVSSARDLARFYSALLSGQILSSTSLARMKQTVEAGPDIGYGLGILTAGVRCGREWGHGGGILDYITRAYASEKGDRIGVVSVYGRLASAQPDESGLVCPNYRLAKSAATQHIALTRGGDIYAMNADGSRQRRLVDGGEPAWSPDGRMMAFVRGGAVYVIHADGSRQRRVVGGSDPAWSPNGRTIAFLREGAVHVMHADGTRQRMLARGSALAWSPDGQRIAFVRGRGNKAEIYVMNVDGSGQRRLARGSDPAWSPDGRRIAFASWIPWKGVGGQNEIFVMNADGGGQRRLTHNAMRDDAPAWSPDGRKITFEARGGSAGGGHSWGWYGVHVVSADGTGQPKGLSGGEPLEDRIPRAARPRWSPDGRMIAFLASKGGRYDVYVMNADGSGETNVTRSKGDEASFAWAPAPD